MLNKSSLITNICFAIDNCFPHQKVSGYMRVVVAQNVCAFSFVHSAIAVVVVIVLMRVPRVNECVLLCTSNRHVRDSSGFVRGFIQC